MNILRLTFRFKMLVILIIGLFSYIPQPGLTETKKEIDLNNTGQRIVALTSISADLVNSISNDSLVGIPGSSLFNNRKDFMNKIIISQGRNPPNLEKIIKLKPTLVIGAKGFHDKVLSKLEEFSIKTIATDIRNFSDLEELSNVITKNSNILKFSLKNKLPNCYNLKPIKKDSTIVLVSTKPILSPNSKSWSGNLLNRFKINNLSAELEAKSSFRGYANLSSEWLISKNPENLILISTPGSDLSKYKKLEYWNKLKAVKNDNIYEFEYYGFINPGSLLSINNACTKLQDL